MGGPVGSEVACPLPFSGVLPGTFSRSVVRPVPPFFAAIRRFCCQKGCVRTRKGCQGVRPKHRISYVLVQFSTPRRARPQNAVSHALESKANRYGELQLPYIIAVDMVAMESFGCDSGEVLFGTEVFLIDRHTDKMTVTRSPLLSDRPSQENGLWFARRGPRNQQVSAVLLVQGVVYTRGK